MKRLSIRAGYRLILALALGIFVLVNLLAAQISTRVITSFDLTANQLYALSDETIAIGESLADETTIYVFSNELDFPSAFGEILSRYEGLSPYLTVSYQDVYESPVLLESYRQQGYDIAEMDLLVVQGSRARHIPYDELLAYTGKDVTGFNMEQAVSSALLTIGEDAGTVLFTLGHNENVSGALKNMFTQNNFEVEEGILAADKDMIVIASPTADFTADECAMLDEYIRNGGHVIAFVEAGASSMPNLEGLLATYNMALTHGLVLENQAYMGNNPLNIMPMYTTHAINSYFSSNAIYTVMPSSRGIQLLADTTGGIETTGLLMSTTGSYTKEDVSVTTTQEDSDPVGPFHIAAISEVADGGDLVVIGSGKCYSDDILTSSAYANGLFFTQIVDYLDEDSSTLNIPAKTMTLDPLVIQSNVSLMIGALVVVVLPVAILTMGAVTVMKRKKL